MDFQNKKVIVTGGSSGIGAGIARELAGRGAQVLAVSRKIEPDDLPFDNITTAKFDLNSNEGVDALFDFAVEKLGVIDLFIANAGFGYYGKTEKPDWNQMESIFNLNVFSPIYALEKCARCIQSALLISRSPRRWAENCRFRAFLFIVQLNLRLTALCALFAMKCRATHLSQ